VELAVDIRNDAKTIEYDSTVSDALRQSANRIRENADAILSEQKTIQIYSHDILLSLKNHIKLSGDIVALRKELDNLRNANQATRQESLKQLYDYLVWLWGIGFVILICGGFTILYTRKIGGFLIGIGLLTIGFASAAHFYLQQIAIIGLFALIFGILITIGVIVWLIIDANRKEKAVEENVTLIEEVKKDLEPDLKEKIFGDEGIAAEVQSDSTKKIVAKIRSNIESSE
jgi:multisubunit Na+/H+ antiporter MnhG subunit